MRSLVRVSGWLCALALASAPAIVAQAERGSVSGTVVDASGLSP